ncbi:unnamed protein product [Schistosoma mattheei]|uniref:Uncharacterized protein n=1 Tax=Schistosoma mattheei TaxID=31246 RepID=A0A183PNZ7_9TREM|nr:unnamed protein product [Schistosoma mattheei]
MRNLYRTRNKVIKRLKTEHQLPAEVSANYTMPGWIVSFVAFFFNKSSNILLNVICFQCLNTNFHYFSLHFF